MSEIQGFGSIPTETISLRKFLTVQVWNYLSSVIGAHDYLTRVDRMSDWNGYKALSYTLSDLAIKYEGEIYSGSQLLPLINSRYINQGATYKEAVDSLRNILLNSTEDEFNDLFSQHELYIPSHELENVEFNHKVNLACTKDNGYISAKLTSDTLLGLAQIKERLKKMLALELAPQITKIAEKTSSELAIGNFDRALDILKNSDIIIQSYSDRQISFDTMTATLSTLECININNILNFNEACEDLPSNLTEKETDIAKYLPIYDILYSLQYDLSSLIHLPYTTYIELVELK